MSLTDSKWTYFQIDAEEEMYGLDRIVEAHNEIYGKMEYAQKCMVELQKENEELKVQIRLVYDLVNLWNSEKLSDGDAISYVDDVFLASVSNEYVKKKINELKEQSK